MIVRSWLNVRVCQLSEPALISPHVGELTNEIEIFNDESSLVRIAASAACIQNTAALKEADGMRIATTQNLNFIPESIGKFSQSSLLVTFFLGLPPINWLALDGEVRYF